MIRVQLSLPRDARYVPLMRNVTTCLMKEMDVPADACDDVLLALSEACANVVRHAAGSHDYSVAVGISSDRCEVEVADGGPGFEQTEADVAPPDVLQEGESGRGLHLIGALVDDMEFLPVENGTRVLLRKRWDAGGGSLSGLDSNGAVMEVNLGQRLN